MRHVQLRSVSLLNSGCGHSFAADESACLNFRCLCGKVSGVWWWAACSSKGVDVARRDGRCPAECGDLVVLGGEAGQRLGPEPLERVEFGGLGAEAFAQLRV